MNLGIITGKTTTLNFKFKVEKSAKKFQYLRVPFKNGNVLAQIIEIEKNLDETIANCIILGFKRENKDLEALLIPLEPGNEVLDADDEFIKESLGLEKEKGAFIGTLDGRSNLKVFLDLNKILTKHTCILAKSGSGKCISPKTKLLLEDGSYETIGKIVDDRLKKNRYVEDCVEISNENDEDLEVFALNRKNSIVKTKINAFMRRKYNQKLILIKTRTGKRIEVTEEHKIPTLDEAIYWKDAKELKKGDFLIIPRPEIEGKNQVIDVIELCKDEYDFKVEEDNIKKIIIEKIYSSGINLRKFSSNFSISYSGFKNWFDDSGIPLKELIKMCKLLKLNFGEIKKKIKFIRAYTKKIPTNLKVDKKFSKLFAYLLAEGHNNGKMISFTNSCTEIRQECGKLFKELFGVCTAKTKHNEFRVYSQGIAKVFWKLGFTNSSWTKFIHRKIITSKQDIFISFLEGFIDCDGHVSKNKPSLEINLASKKLVEGIECLLMRCGIVPVRTRKNIKGKLYPKLSICGSKNFKILDNFLNFKIKHKKERLSYFSKQTSNPNIEIVPNVSENLRRIFNILNMHEFESRIKGFWSYVRKARCPSFETLNVLLEDVEAKYCFIEKQIEKAVNIYRKLPQMDEKTALNYIKKCHSNGISFQKLSYHIDVSGSTVGRMVRGDTKLTNNVYVLAENSLKLMGIEDDRLKKVEGIDFVYTLRKIRNVCFNLGYKISSLCCDNQFSELFICENLRSNRSLLYSNLLKLSESLKTIALNKKDELIEAKQRLSFLKSLVKNNLFFDEIISIEKFPYKGYVYDLETEEHNFIANNILIHNSYSAGVLLEEIIEEKIPLLVIDPHGEYSSMKQPNNEEKDKLGQKGLLPKGYNDVIEEYTPDTNINSECKSLKLSNKSLTPSMLVHLLPAKLSNAQLGILYSALQNSKAIDFDELMINVDAEDNNLKYTVLNIIDYIKKLDIFSDNPTALQELIQPGKASVINLKGIPPEVSEIVVYKLLKDLFEARKKGNLPPFFLVIEEAHNYAPERGFGEAKSSNVLRQIASEGRKFGLGLCLHPETSIKCNPKIDKIKNLEKGEKIITFNLDKNSLETEEIINTIEINPSQYNLDVFNLETETGRSIISSEEHPFLTKQGWKKLRDINKNDFVAIYPVQSPIKKTKSKQKIVSIKTIRKILNKYVENNKKVWNKYNHKEILEKLKRFSLLTYSDKESLVLARIVGHILSDGCMRSNKKGVTFYLDSLDVAKEVKRDLKFLKITYGKTEKIVGNWGTEYRVETTVKPFWVLMVSLGCPVGKKSSAEFLVPCWIKKAPKDIKREFLAALFGGDGSPSNIKDTKRRHVSYFCFSKHPYLEKNGIDYANELKELFSEFNVEIGSIKIKKHERRVGFELIFGSKRENTIKLFENIGVRYTNYKKKKMNQVLEYMKYQEKILNNRRKKINKIKKLYSKNNSINNISKIINEDWHFVKRIIEQNYLIKINKRKDVLTFDQWIKDRESKGGIVWEKINNKKLTNYKGKLFDIETERNHNFLANSFLTHNCIISQRPARVDKNVLSQITTQFILKVTNPNDLKAISASVEGITAETEKEIRNIPIGTAMVVGVVNQPLLVNIRTRRSKHGGEAIDVLGSVRIEDKKEDFMDEMKKHDEGMLLVVKQKNTVDDIKLMSTRKIKEIKTRLIPCCFLRLKKDNEEFNVLVNLYNKEVIVDTEKIVGIKLPNLENISKNQFNVLKVAVELGKFTAAQLFEKSKLQFSEVYDVMNALTMRGIFIKNGGYELSPNLNILHKLNECKVFEKPDFVRMEFDEKIEKNIDEEEVVKLLSNFFEVIENKECWLENFKIGYEEEKDKNK